jgi:hypothetical protein
VYSKNHSSADQRSDEVSSERIIFEKCIPENTRLSDQGLIFVIIIGFPVQTACVDGRMEDFSVV